MALYEFSSMAFHLAPAKRKQTNSCIRANMSPYRICPGMPLLEELAGPTKTQS